MKVTGFTFIKNALLFQYPVVEAIRSVLPLCDTMVIAVGNSTDDTRSLVAAIDQQKIKILDTVWDDNVREGGRVLALETDKAFQAIDNDADWCFYIQGDEVLHEDGYDEIREAMHRWKNDKQVDGFLFKYRHFYGSYDYIGTASRWYKREIRIVRNDKNIFSYRDAQGFRKGANKKLSVKSLDAHIHHYGWVRPPEAMAAKARNFSRYWSGPAAPGEPVKEMYDYSAITDSLQKFTGTHPKVMQPLIQQLNWTFAHDPAHNKTKPKEQFKNLVEKLTGKRPFDFNNYKII
jgi:hypothetical protein